MSKSMLTPIGRISFPKLVKPDQYMPESKPKYSLALLIPKNEPQLMPFLKELKQAVTDAAREKHGEAQIPTAISNFSNLKDGDDVSLFKTYRAEYAGHYVLNMSRLAEHGKACTVNRDKQPIDPSEIYAGCNGRAFIDVYGYTAGPKKGVTIGFQHVQKTGENTPFSSTGTPVDDAFSDLGIEETPEGTGLAQGPQGPQGPTKTPIADPFAGV